MLAWATPATHQSCDRLREHFLEDPSCGCIALEQLEKAVFVWAGRLHQDMDLGEFADATGLSEAERRRLSGFRFREDALGFASAHGVLRLALGACLRCSPADVCIRANNYGKPFLENPRLNAGVCVEFSLSHCKDLAAVAFSNQPIGVDIEYLRQMESWVDLTARIFPQYLDDILSAPLDRSAAKFLRYWCLHEAVAKAEGLGLSMAFSDIAFSADDPPRVEWKHDSLRIHREWQMSSAIGGTICELNCGVR